jgi:glycosyltransferase involved in cell wall biosynthesis
MKIAHVIMSIDPTRGGPSLSVPSLARAQRELGHHAVVVTPEHDDWSSNFRQYDLVHQHGVWELPLARLNKRLQYANVPYCVSLRGTLDRWSRRQKLMKKSVAWWLYQRRLLMNAHAIFALTPDEVDEAREWLPHPHYVVAPNAVSRPETMPDDSLFFETFPQISPDTGPIILFLARLHYKKGLALLPEILERVLIQHPTARLVIAGSAKPEQQPYLEAMRQDFAQRRLVDSVYEIGMVTGDLKWSALVASSLFILPSHEEGMPMAVLEAIAAGRPVVISPGCHLSLIAEHDGGFVRPLDPELFAEGICQLLDHPDKCRAMGAAAADLASNEFNWHVTAQKVLDAYPN